MFLKSEAEAAVNSLKNTQKAYKCAVTRLTNACLSRHETCSSIKNDLQQRVEDLENRLEATLDKDLIANDVFVRLKKETVELSSAIKDLNLEDISVDDPDVNVKKASVGVAAGIGTGAAIGTLGPTAALAYASTFGVASTGTAISTLSGAAATNATLAYLGFGGGMAAGEMLLGLAGPIGWSIAAIGIVGGGLYFRSKNKQAIEDAQAAEKKIVEVKSSVLCLAREIKNDANLNAVRVKDTLKHINYIHMLADNSGITDQLVKELYLLESNVKQLTAYVKKRIEPIEIN